MNNNINYALEAIYNVTDMYYLDKFEQHRQSSANIAKLFTKNHRPYSYIDSEKNIRESKKSYKLHVNSINKYIRTKYVPMRKNTIAAVNKNSKRKLDKANITINKIVGKYNYNIYHDLNYTDTRLELIELTPNIESVYFNENILDVNTVAQVAYYQISIINVGNLFDNMRYHEATQLDEKLFNSIEMEIRSFYNNQFNIFHDNKSVIVIPNMDDDSNYNKIKKELENIEYNYYQNYRYK